MRLDELGTLITRRVGDGRAAVLDGVLVSRVEEPGPPATGPSGVVFALIAQGAKTLAVGDRLLEYRAGQYLVASLDLPVTGTFTEASPDRPALGVGLTLRPAGVAALLLDA